MLPAMTVCDAGVAETEKSRTDNVTVAERVTPLLVPVMVNG